MSLVVTRHQCCWSDFAEHSSTVPHSTCACIHVYLHVWSPCQSLPHSARLSAPSARFCSVSENARFCSKFCRHYPPTPSCLVFFLPPFAQCTALYVFVCGGLITTTSHAARDVIVLMNHATDQPQLIQTRAVTRAFTCMTKCECTEQVWALGPKGVIVEQMSLQLCFTSKSEI